MTSAQQFAFEKAIEAEQRWSELSLDVCHLCDDCKLIKMSWTMVELARAQANFWELCPQSSKKHRTESGDSLLAG
jgi:hypothetical protein